jgi:RNA polymerase sigma-70 factor (ECF subfamily)
MRTTAIWRPDMRSAAAEGRAVEDTVIQWDVPADVMSRIVDELPGLRRYAHALVSDPEQAEDLVQDTVVRAIEKRSTFEARSSMATWLHRIMHNLAVDASRRRREMATDIAAGDGDQIEVLWGDDSYTVDSAAVVERAHQRAALQDALLRIPLIYRSAVVLHDAEGLPMSAVAEIQQIGLPAAKQRLRRGRMMLVTELSGPDPEREQEPAVPMRCWDARKLVSDYMDDELAPRERRLLEMHLEGCPTCPPLYAGLVGVREALGARRDSDEAVPADLADRIRTQGES